MYSSSERTAFIKFINHFKKEHRNLDFPTYILEDLLSDSNDGIFGIFLHMSDDCFSDKFSNLLSQNVVNNLNLLTWDISNPSLNTYLMDRVNESLDNKFLINLLETQEGGLVLFKSDNNKINILKSYKGDFNLDDFIRDVTNICDFKEPIFQKDDYTSIEFSNLISIGIEVEDNLKSAIQKSFKEEKLLLLHLHNNRQVLSQTFWDILSNTDINHLINKFIVYPCDLLDSETIASIKNLFQEFKFLNIVDFYVLTQQSVILVFKRLDGNVKSECFKGNVSQQELLTDLFKIYTQYEQEKIDILYLQEKKCLESAVDNFMSMFCKNNLSLEKDSLNNALEQQVLVQPEYLRKILIICLYDEKDSDCIDLFSHIFDNQDIENVVCAMYHILLWNVKDKNIHKALKYLNKFHFDDKSIEQKIENEETGLFFVQAVDERVKIILEYNLRDFDPKSFKNILAVLTKNFMKNNGATDLYEVKAAQIFSSSNLISFSHNSIFECLPLQRLISKKCTVQNVTERKMLLLHLQNGSEKNKFLKRLPKIFKDLKKYFCVLAWDMSRPPIRKKLFLANERYFRSEKINEALKNQKSESFIFIPTTNTMAFAGNLSTFKNLIKLFEKEKKEFSFDKGPFVFQQQLCNQLGDRDYNYFNLENPEQVKFFHDWIGFAIFGLPSEKKDKYTKDQIEHINEVKKQIQTQAEKYSVNPKNIYVACVFICSIPSGESFKNHISLPVIAVQKCIKSPGRSCRFYVDSNLRVYSSWENYLKENNLVRGTFIVPQDGSYQIDCYGRVRLECIYDKKILAKVVNSLDKVSTITGVGATVVTAVGSFTAIAVAPVVLAGATAAGIGVGVYVLGRGAYNLYDRHTHEESMDIRDREARMAYLNLAAGAFSFTTAGATAALSYFARNGREIGKISMNLINLMSGANIAVNGVNIGNSFYDVICNWRINGQIPNALMILQLTSSVLFFGHSVYNAQSANTIINEAQAQKMYDLQRNLSNKQRRMFNKMTKETVRQHGNVQQGYREVISTLNSMDNVKDFLATLGRNNKQFNQKNVKFSLANGEVHFNGVKVDLKTFDSLSNSKKMDYLASQNTIPKGNLKHRIDMTNSIKNHFNPTLILNAASIVCKIGSELYTKDASKLSMFSEMITDLLMRILRRFLEKVALDDYLDKSLSDLASGTPLDIIIDYFAIRAVRLIRVFMQSSGATSERLNCIEKVIMLASLNIDGVIRELLKFAVTWLAQKAFATEINSEENLELEKNEGILCKICEGRHK